jgi:hypothetical protein
MSLTIKQRQSILESFNFWLNENADIYYFCAKYRYLHHDGKHIVSKTLFSQASKSLKITAGLLKDIIEESGWSIVTDKMYEAAETAEYEKRNEERAREKAEEERSKKEADVAGKVISSLVGFVVILIIGWIVFNIANMGPIQSSAGDRSCEQLGGRPSGDRCVFR